MAKGRCRNGAHDFPYRPSTAAMNNVLPFVYCCRNTAGKEGTGVVYNERLIYIITVWSRSNFSVPCKGDLECFVASNERSETR